MKPLRMRKNSYPGPGGMLVCSFLLHLALLTIVATFRLYPEAHPLAEETYYVDMVSLPVASPAKGNPAPTATPQQSAAPEAIPEPPRPAPQHTAPAKAAPAPSRPTMTYPTAKAKPSKQKPSDDNAPTGAETKAFQERMAKLERQAEDRRQADVLSRLRKGAGGKIGMPNGTGTQAGSNYASYIQSRLIDAFSNTMASQSQAPQMTVRLTIGADGKIVRRKIEKSTQDRMFEDSVDRAIHIAEKTFPKPPGGNPVEVGFIFHPDGVKLK